MSLYDHGPMGQKVSNQRGTPEERRYNKWLGTWDMGHGQCVLTGRWDIERAHTSDVGDGKGMAYKGPLKHVLTLSLPIHHFEERNRDMFWPRVGFPGNTRFDWAERLYDIFEVGDDPSELFADMQAKANRTFLADILSR